ncbi:MAG: 6-phospho-beta-glucosidase [Propionibacteriales bacterium]|nr:6-phospho-beta-glucosidase [Propionibacteriales bacterium]
MRLTILGGGGFRVPLVFRALCEDPALGVDELMLHDVDPARLTVVASVLEHLAASAGGRAPAVRLSSDLRDAVRGADFVFSAIRVAGLQGRICDERSALSHGVIGQETTGAGGVTYGLRTVPAALQVADVIAAEAPAAWVINFTNPAGLVTEAMRARLGDRVIGICDSPVGLFRRVARALDVDPATATFDYAGLNHLGWLRRVVIGGEDRLPGLLADPDRLQCIEEGRLFGQPWLRTLGSIPNEYLWYWYFRTDALASGRAAEQTRGEFLLGQQQAFYDGVQGAGAETSYARWEQARRDREESYMADSRAATGSGERDSYDLDGGGYDQVALAVMRAVGTDAPQTLVLNVPNRGTLPFLDDDAVIEVPCRIDGSGPVPMAVGALDLHAQGLVTSVKAVERTTIAAAHHGSRELAVKALSLHPLVGSVPVARAILADQLAALPELAQVLPHT